MNNALQSINSTVCFFLNKQSNYLLHQKVIILLVIIFLASTGQAQKCLELEATCSTEAQFGVTVTNGQLIFTPSLVENPAWTYHWGWEDGNGNTFEQTGYSIALPLTDDVLIIRLLVTDELYFSSLCIKTVDIQEDCEVAGFSTAINKCGVNFGPNPIENLLSSTWDFGDNSGESHDNAPFHIYGNSGSYEVFHAVVYQDESNPDPAQCFVRYCSQDVPVDCTPGSGPGFTYIKVDGTCCQLVISFTPDNMNGDHWWDFGDGTTSNLVEPSHQYTNISTFSNATPQVEVEHCVTNNGVQQCTTMVVVFGVEGIFIGYDNVQTSISGLLSTIDGTELLPANSINGTLMNPLMINVSGELYIEKDFEFNNVEFCMNPAAGMKVPSERHLSLTESVADNADGCPIWRGIDVEQTSFFTGYASHVMHALYGLRTLNSGAIVSLSFFAFDNNFIGIFDRFGCNLTKFEVAFFDAITLDPLGGLTPDPIIPAPYIAGGRGFAGIYCSNSSLNIPESSFGTNYFFNLANGIWLENSNAWVRRCSTFWISNDTYGDDLSGDGIRFNDVTGGHSLRQWGLGTSDAAYNSFNECVTGIRVTNAGPNTFVQSQDNKMIEVSNGYKFQIGGNLAVGSKVVANDIACARAGVEVNIENPGMISNLSINDNQVAVGAGDVIAPGIGVWLNDNSGMPSKQNISVFHNQDIDLFKGRAGIATSNFFGASISTNHINIYAPLAKRKIGIYLEYGGENRVICSNHITGFAPPSTLGKSFGIFSEESIENLISENTTKNTQIGLSFDMPCGTLNNIKCNQMQGHQVGLSYSKSAVTGKQLSMGNKWLGTWTSGNLGAQHYSDDDDIIGQSWYTASNISTPSSGSEWPLPFGIDLTPNAGDPWFFPGSTSNCDLAPCDVMVASPDINLTDTVIATTGFSMAGYEEIYDWINERYLYSKLAQDPSIEQNSTIMQSFKNSLQGSATDLLYTSNTLTKSLFEVEPTAQDNLDALYSNIQASLSQMEVIDADLAVTTSDEERLSLAQSKLQLQNDLNGYYDQSNYNWNQILTTRTTQTEGVANDNDLIVANYPYEQNEKELIGMYLRTKAKGMPLTLADLETLCDIAHQCPLEGGPVTYWAKSWFSAETGVMITTDDCDLEDESINEFIGTKNSKSTVEQEMSIVPNPARMECRADFSVNSNGEKIYLNVFNQLGSREISKQVESGSGSQFLDISQLSPGIYFVHLVVDGRKTAIEKLVVL